MTIHTTVTIRYFGEHQNDVFLPALGAVAVAALLVALPVVRAPGLLRARRTRVVGAVCGLAAAAALVLAGQQTAVGFRTLQQERALVVSTLRADYGVAVDAAQAGTLVNGGGLSGGAFGEHTLKLASRGGADYVPVLGGKALPRSG